MEPVYPHVKQFESRGRDAAGLGETFELRPRSRRHGARKRRTRILAAIRVRRERTAPAGC
jgi:hypothetical protein